MRVFIVLIGFLFLFQCGQDTKTKSKSSSPKWEDQVTHNGDHMESPLLTQDEKRDSINRYSNYKEKGLKYALGTQAVLGKHVMKTIQGQGLEGAVQFCNINAYPLTDSMAVFYNAQIKRVTDKPRNPENQANAKEIQHIETFKKAISTNQEPTPIIEAVDNQMTFYYPIVTNGMCLQCHGKVDETLDRDAYKTMTLLYPNDKAIGYEVNEVRGLWRVTFNE